jgi:hypothetical protein
VIKSLADDNRVCIALESTAVARSFPRRDRLSVEVVDVLVRVLEDGYIVFDPSVTAIRHCYEKGLIHRILATDGPGQGDTLGILPSRLHEK